MLIITIYQTTTIMNNEQFYDELRGYILEYTEEYITKIKSIALEVLGTHPTGVDLEELEWYLEEQENIFHDKLQEVLAEVRADIDADETGSTYLKVKTLERIRESFKTIFNKIVSQIKDILG